ncbi:TPA: hypothetical protein ACH3X1_006599 [Trebouxia sp. C0004]
MHFRHHSAAGLAAVLCLLIFASLASAKQWSPQNFPNPATDVTLCGRNGKPSWICDPDRILSEYSQDVIEGSIHEIAAAKSPYRPANCPDLPHDAAGYQVAVVLVQSLKLQNGRSEAEQAEYFAKSLHKAWGVGNKNCNNGLVFLLSKDDRQMYLAADGQVLSKERQQYVLNNAKAKLRAGNFDGGIEGAIVDIGLALSGADLPGDTDSSQHWDWGLGIFGAIFGGFLCNSCWSGYRRRREAKVCRSLLQKLKDEQATAVRNQQYPATSCPICFEDLAKPDVAPASPSASGAGMAGAYKGDQSSGFGATSSTKSDVEPSAPPLESRSEYESLLGKDRERPSLQQDEHNVIRSSDSKEKQLKPLSLACGHTFCEECISRWLHDKNSCPVCRKPLTGDDPSEDPYLTSGSAAQAAAGGLNRQQQIWDNDMYASEVMFRMGRLQRLYPYYVTRDMISDWGTHTSQGQAVNWDAARSMLNNPEIRQSRHDWGSQGATTDFGGGGGNYGGGGTGGSW